MEHKDICSSLSPIKKEPCHICGVNDEINELAKVLWKITGGADRCTSAAEEICAKFGKDNSGMVPQGIDIPRLKRVID